MERHEMLRIQQNVNHGLEEVIADVIPVRHSGFRYTGESKPRSQIARRKIVGVGNDREKVALGPKNRSRRAAPSGEIRHEKAHFDGSVAKALRETGPTLFC